MNADLSKLLNSLTVGSVAGLFLVAFAVSASGAGMLSNPLDDSTATAPAEVDSSADYQGFVNVQHERDVDGDGEYETVDTYKGHNQIVDQGLNFFECIASNVGCSALGSGTTADPTPAPGDTAIQISVSDANSDGDGDGDTDVFDDPTATSLNGEISSGNLSRTGGTQGSPTVSDQGTGHYSTEYTFEATSDFSTDPIEFTGLHWTGEPGADDLVAANHFPGVTMLADDKLTISWTEVSFSESTN